MKHNLRLTLAALAASIPAALMAGTPVEPSSLPQAAQTFITRHFPGQKVRKAEQEQGRRGTEYEVDLTGGTEIDFTENGDWKEVKAARGAAVPAAIIPKAIAAYVAENFKGLDIVEIGRKRGGYEVELSNGTELKLTEDAKPMPAGQRGHRH